MIRISLELITILVSMDLGSLNTLYIENDSVPARNGQLFDLSRQNMTKTRRQNETMENRIMRLWARGNKTNKLDINTSECVSLRHEVPSGGPENPMAVKGRTNFLALRLTTSETASRMAAKMTRRKRRITQLTVSIPENKISIRMVIMLPSVSPSTGIPSVLSSGGALSVALDRIRSEGILTNVNLTVIWKDTECQESEALGESVELHMRDEVDVFFGPACHSALKAVSLLCSYWGVPIISWFPTESNLTLHPGHSQLSNFYGTYSDISNAILQVLRHFNWSNIALVHFDKDVFCRPLSDVIKYQFPKNNVNAMYTALMVDEDAATRAVEWEKLKVKARVIFLCSSSSRVRHILREADDIGLGNSEYAFVYFNFGVKSLVKEMSSAGDSGVNILQAVIEIGSFISDSDQYMEFVSQAKNLSDLSSLNATTNVWKIDDQAVFFHDAILAYSYALNHSMFNRSGYKRDSMVDVFKDTLFSGLTGNVTLTPEGVRQPEFQVLHFQHGSSELVATITSVFKWTPGIEVLWFGGTNQTPPDSPPCGFQWERCPPSNTNNGEHSAEILGIALTAVAICAVLLSFCIYRRLHYEKRLAKTTWRIDLNDLKMTRSTSASSGSPGHSTTQRLVRTNTPATLVFGSACSLDRTQQLFTPIGNYKGNVVSVKHLKSKLILNPETLRDLKFLKELRQQNINPFVGAEIREDWAVVLTQYCSKGSLQDVLENDDINLDQNFKMSFATDIARGLAYLHKSSVNTHGNLKSSNCVVDSRWTVSLTDTRLISPHLNSKPENMGTHEYYRRMLWTAPELLRETDSSAKGTQSGDVYSYGIILYEILLRTSPYHNNDADPEDIISMVKENSISPYRPKIPTDSDVPVSAISLMTSCWDETPSKRPPLSKIRRRLVDINGGRKANVMDNMLRLLESHTNNLEDLVSQRTEQLQQEREKTERLLYQLLPRSVADQLKSGQSVEPEFFEESTILFSDIVGFTSICSDSSPLQVVELLNDLYTMFDQIITKHDVYKVETIGDAYMCVSGIPIKNGQRHAREICNMALSLLDDVTTFHMRNMPSERLRLRIGVHTGDCVAGVVGLTMPRYCLFGDTVNIASRMESNGQELRIQISDVTNKTLADLNEGFVTEKRGYIPIKGKGEILTYWLIGKEVS